MKRGFILALFLAGAALPAHADDLSDVIAKHLAWRGGAAYEKVATLHETGELEGGGLHGPFEIWLDRAGRSRTDVDLGVVRNRDVVTPDGGYTINQSGQIENASDFAREVARRGGLIEFGDALRGKGGAKLTLLPSEQRDGRTWSVVRVSFGGADTYDLFLDPRTGEEAGVRVVENRRNRFDAYSDWRLVDGVRIPFEIKQDSDVDAADVSLHVKAVEVNKPFDAALFARPAAVKSAVFAPGKTSTGWIDFEYFGGNRIYFPARINGVDTVVLLDSGAESTVFDKRFADKLGLKPQGEVAAMGTGGASTAGLIPGVDIQIGALTLKNLTVASLDLAAIEKQLGHDLPVILGKEVFNQLVVDIDFDAHRIAFHDPEGFVQPAGSTEVPITLVDGLRAVPVSVEGRPEVLFDFDIGNGGPLIIFPAYWEGQKLLEGRPQSTVRGGAVGGLRENRIATIRSLRFAGTTFTNIPTTFSPPGPSGVDSDHTLGNVGLPILSRFRLITDYPKDRLYLTPNPKLIGQPFPKDHLGLGIVKQADGFLVDFIAPGGPAEAAGLKKGDRIAAIDGKPAEAWQVEALRGLRYLPLGQVLVLKMADGTEKRVKLAEYF